MAKITDRCILIVGAGASQPYGLPLGRKLRDLILEIRPTSKHTEGYLDEVGLSAAKFKSFQTDFQRSGYTSIDAFLGVRPHWLAAGKFAISYCLMTLENTSKLFPPSAPKDHWFESLWHRLRKSSWKELQKTHLRIITFNYDRCLEFYLATVIANNYGIPTNKVLKWLLDEIVIHVHGTLGEYQITQFFWDDKDDDMTIIEGLQNSMRSIVVISEANPKTRAFSRARKYLKEATSIAFIGFGFHKENMARLGIVSGEPDWPNLSSLTCSHKGIKGRAWTRLYVEYFQPFELDDSHKAATISQLVQEFVYV